MYKIEQMQGNKIERSRHSENKENFHRNALGESLDSAKKGTRVSHCFKDYDHVIKDQTKAK